MTTNLKQTSARCAFAMALLISTLPIWAQNTMPEAKAIAAYPLTMDHVTKTLQATDLPSDRTISDLPLEDRIKRLDATPAAAAVLKAHGISSRDFIMTGAAVGSVVAVAGLMDLGEKGPGSSDANHILWAAAPPDHIKFYRDHKAEIDKLVIQTREAILKRKR